MIQFQEDKSDRRLEILKRKEEEDSAKIISDKYGLPYLDLNIFPVEPDALGLVSLERAVGAEMAVIQMTGKKLKIAVRNPQKEETKSTLKILERDGYAYDLYMVSPQGLRRAWEFYEKIKPHEEEEAGVTSVRSEKISEIRKSVKNLEELKNAIEKKPEGGASEVLEIILAGALALKASDIHVEPQKDKTRLRYRLDGILQEAAELEKKLSLLLLSRVKLLSELKLNVHNKAQDGRFTIKIEKTEIEVRSSIMPGPDGENIVLRILDPETLRVKFEELGMQSEVVKIMEKELKKPNGMILTTGPTGSGKTTTLYAFLNKIQSPEIKVITLEDPIEYHLPGIEQTQIDEEKGYGFAEGLRSSLRQDPDVILVGEIRDKDTAETALHASLTGHLVFSTLHTNNAAGTIPRLLDLGVKPAVIAPALNIAMAQRLVRKLCVDCRKKTELSLEKEKNILEKLASFPKNVPLPEKSQWNIFEADKNGCSGCHQGYKGRAGVYEIILIDENMESLIMKEPSEFEIKKAALVQGRLNMNQDALLKILSGITDFSEVERVVAED